MIKDWHYFSCESPNLNLFICWQHDFVGGDGNGGDNKSEE